MGLVELSVSVRSVQSRIVQQSLTWAWLDPDADSHREFELPLLLHADWRWVGVMGFAETSAENFFYRLGIVAHAGAEWSLNVRDRTTGRDILFDTDMLTSAKCWLIGSCPLRA